MTGETRSPVCSDSTRMKEPDQHDHSDKEDVVEDGDMNIHDDTSLKTESHKPVVPSWITSLKPDNRAQPWRVHEGIAEDRSFTEGSDMVLMEAAAYPGGSLAA